MTKKLATFVFRTTDKNKAVYSFVESDDCIAGDVFKAIKKAAKTLYGCDAEITAEYFNHAELKCNRRNYEVFKVNCVKNP